VKEELCKAFCGHLTVRAVPAGLAVSTAFDFSDGEPVGFYVVGPDSMNRYRLEDDGTTIPLIEAAGADLETQTRREALDAMMQEYGATFDVDRGELKTAPLKQDDIPQAALRFVALLLRLQDIILLTPERVASTFREDAIKALRDSLGTRASINENAPIAHGVEFHADLIIEAAGRDPVAVFLAMSEQRLLEAVVAQMAATYEAQVPCSVIALLDKEGSVSRRMRQRAGNRLAAMPIYEGDERAAIHRIELEVLGRHPTLH